LIAVAGIALTISSVISGIGNLSDDLSDNLQQVVVPGNSDLMLSKTGEYIIFYENQTVVNGRVYSTDEDIPGLLIEVKNKTTGQDISTYSPGGSFSYSFGGRSGRSVVAFFIEQPGIYELSASYPQSDDGHEVVLAVGNNISGEIMSSIMLPLLLFFGSIGAAIVIAFITYRKRQEAAKRAEEEERRIRGS
jgi:hypothetical protein